eukprot:1282495-Pyramimonas_sp.AAC.1
MRSLDQHPAAVQELAAGQFGDVEPIRLRREGERSAQDATRMSRSRASVHLRLCLLYTSDAADDTPC